jgi:CheY-like chemotaxis protein
MARVLLVEDSPTQAVEMKMLLEEASHQVCHVTNGKLGLEALESDALDVVVTDLEMPELNGLQLVEQMRLDYAHVPAILVTGQGSEELAAEALQRGAAGYVPKSQMRTLLNDTITDVLGVIRSDASYAKLISTLTKNVFIFDMPNDADLVAPLVGLLMQVVSGMDLIGGIELVRLGVAVENAVLNAMYRGNLELPPEQTPATRAAIYDDATTAAIEQRKTRAPYKDRKVHVEFIASEHAVRVVVRDCGNGFDTSALPAAGNPDLLDTERGRGLVLMTSFVDQLLFNEKGNEVTLIKRCQRSD